MTLPVTPWRFTGAKSFPRDSDSDAALALEEFLDSSPETADDEPLPPDVLHQAFDDSINAIRDAAKGRMRGANGRRLAKGGDVRRALGADGAYVHHLLRCDDELCAHTERITGDELLLVLRYFAATRPGTDVPLIGIKRIVQLIG